MSTPKEGVSETKVEPQDTVTAPSIDGSSDIYIDPILERRTMAKYDKFLLPQMATLIILAYLDRSNIGNAKVFGFEEGIGLKGIEFNNISTLFYVTYVIFEIPWVMAVKRFGANKTLAVAMTCWSIVTLGTGFIKNYGQALVMRLLLGACEAGLFPCLTFFISTVYSRESQAKRIASLYGASALSGAFGGLIAYGIQTMGTRAGLAPWRWLFIIEGIISFFLGGACWLTMPSTAEKAWFLNQEEKDLMVARSRRDAIYKGDANLFCSSIPLFGFGTFLPTIIKGLGYTSLQANYLTIPIYIVACCTLLVASWTSDKINQRAIVAIIATWSVLIGYIIVIASSSIGAGYFAMFLCAAGIYPYNAMLLTWVSNNLKPDYKRSVGIPLFASLANVPGSSPHKFILPVMDQVANTAVAETPVPAALQGQSNHASTYIADAVGFLSLGGGQSYVGSSSGYALALDLDSVVQATLWNKIRPSSLESVNNMTLADFERDGAGAPDKDRGDRILDAYLNHIHPLYPFLDRGTLQRYHSSRFDAASETIDDKFWTFKLYMVYAIGAQLLKMTEAYEYTPPERFFITAFRNVSAARDAHSTKNVEAMALLVIYHLRSPSNSGIWSLIGMAMRTCVDLGLHREAFYTTGDVFEQELNRRLFWTVYSLERHISISFGRPFSINDRVIDVRLPLDINDDIRDHMTIAQAMHLSRSSYTTTMTMALHLFRLKQLESKIHHKIYRADRSPSDLVLKIEPLLRLLRDWKDNLPQLSSIETDYRMIQYHKAIRLLLQPFLSIMPQDDPRILLCLEASGQICQIFKRLHSRHLYGHSFIALHSIFIAGLTMCYCLWKAPGLWSLQTSNDLRACSSVLCIIAERAPTARGYSNAMDELINATTEHIASMVPPQGQCGQKSLLSDSTHVPVIALAHIQISPDTLSSFCEGGDAAWQMLSQMTNVEDDITRQYLHYGSSTVALGDLSVATPQDYWWP
ncbi:hypothetical protein PV11_01274 [Exophiala sideris]|uniref:Xylanolytic transcriptional activator regulatory domain-containing protein n=1 Tax=Exophiala sideris TaxID=1016849 RepID=A0A0D1XCL2_9EURO|nr:hypothetical protein PV11_01274 [Exophiala sideris]